VLEKGTSEAESFDFNGTPSILVQGPNGTKPLPGFTLDEIEAAIQQVK
jgi:protein-disulfide isomerase